ncbi:MAG: SLC13 family permease, partial [Candidatus Syntrophosphaera sp.]
MQQMIVFVTLILAMAMFVWGRIRYDLVALCALFILAIFGVVSPREAFSGFGHAAVITVVAVMIISRAMLASGVIDATARHLKKLGGNILLQVLTLSAITAVASAFMNNVGALAIMMPIAIQLARKNKYPPSFILMPLAFSSLLGGMTTMIGT